MARRRRLVQRFGEGQVVLLARFEDARGRCIDVDAHFTAIPRRVPRKLRVFRRVLVGVDAAQLDLGHGAGRAALARVAAFHLRPHGGQRRCGAALLVFHVHLYIDAQGGRRGVRLSVLREQFGKSLNARARISMLSLGQEQQAAKESEQVKALATLISALSDEGKKQLKRLAFP